MRIAVASGKGGVGKTTLSVTLASFYADKGRSVALLDCDVEEPNVNLFLGAEILSVEKGVVPVPSVDKAHCTGCGKCADICEYSAIVLIKGVPLVMPLMCHSCGGCILVCPEDVITEVNREIGAIESGIRGVIRYSGGKLNIGEPMSPPLIKEVSKKHPDAEIQIVDSPPGTSCPVIESVKDSDFIILVAESSRFGLNDLELASGMADRLGIPYGVVINRHVEGIEGVNDFCVRMAIPVLGVIPESMDIAVAYSDGDCVSFIKQNYMGELEKITRFIGNKCGGIL